MIKRGVFFLAVMVLFQGCNQVAQPNTPVKLYTPSKNNVIKAGASVYFDSMSSDNYNTKELIYQVKEYFTQNGVFKITTHKQKADVIININTFYSYRADDRASVKFNEGYFVETKVFRDRKGKETGGKDELKSKTFKSSTATLVASISIYDRKKLQPLVYFNVIPSDSSTVSVKEVVNSSESFSSQLTKNVISKLEDMVTTKTKDVNIFLPAKADPQLRLPLLSGEMAKVIENSKTILPQLDLLEVSQKFYAENAKAASQKDSKVVKRDMEADLANFYVYLVAKESTDVSKANIQSLYQGYKHLLKLTADQSLILATSNSLGRVEFKANRLNINLGEE